MQKMNPAVKSILTRKTSVLEAAITSILSLVTTVNLLIAPAKLTSLILFSYVIIKSTVLQYIMNGDLLG